MKISNLGSNFKINKINETKQEKSNYSANKSDSLTFKANSVFPLAFTPSNTITPQIQTIIQTTLTFAQEAAQRQALATLRASNGSAKQELYLKHIEYANSALSNKEPTLISKIPDIVGNYSPAYLHKLQENIQKVYGEVVPVEQIRETVIDAAETIVSIPTEDKPKFGILGSKEEKRRFLQENEQLIADLSNHMLDTARLIANGQDNCSIARRTGKVPTVVRHQTQTVFLPVHPANAITPSLNLQFLNFQKIK